MDSDRLRSPPFHSRVARGRHSDCLRQRRNRPDEFHPLPALESCQNQWSDEDRCPMGLMGSKALRMAPTPMMTPFQRFVLRELQTDSTPDFAAPAAPGRCIDPCNPSLSQTRCRQIRRLSRRILPAREVLGIDTKEFSLTNKRGVAPPAETPTLEDNLNDGSRHFNSMRNIASLVSLSLRIRRQRGPSCPRR